jgi:transketolase
VKTLRDAFGDSLLSLGERYPDLIVVDGDNSLATRTAAFRDAYPDRFIQAGVAEANMMGIAAGLAYSGHRVVAATFAAFLIGRALEVIRDTVVLDQLPVVVVGTHAGISVGRDGITHMALEDVAVTRILPGMTVVCPADEGQVGPLLEQVLRTRAPAYMRVSRWGRGLLPGAHQVRLGSPVRLRDGKNCLIVACGLAVHSAWEGAELLATRGVECGVLAIHTIKPMDWRAFAELASRYECLVVAEEQWSSAGLFGAVSEWLSQYDPKPCIPVGIPDVFPDGGSEESLFEAYGLLPSDIVGAALRAISLTVRDHAAPS